jgi:TatA/E family protein of Tat protein translocase
MFGIGAQELAIILVVALLVFGPKRLPDLARTLGRGLAEFRRASSDLRKSVEMDFSADPKPSNSIKPPPSAANSDPSPTIGTNSQAPAAAPEAVASEAASEAAEAASEAASEAAPEAAPEAAEAAPEVAVPEAASAKPVAPKTEEPVGG